MSHYDATSYYSKQLSTEHQCQSINNKDKSFLGRHAGKNTLFHVEEGRRQKMLMFEEKTSSNLSFTFLEHSQVTIVYERGIKARRLLLHVSLQNAHKGKSINVFE